MTILEELKEIIGFEIPLHERFTLEFGRPIINFSAFSDKYRDSYARQPKTEFYTEIKNRHGAKCVDLLLKLT